MASRFEKFYRAHIQRVASNVISSACDSYSVHKQIHHFHSVVVAPFKGVGNIALANKGDTCSWKGQLEQRENGNFKVGKSEVRDFSLKLESINRSWKVFNAVILKIL